MLTNDEINAIHQAGIDKMLAEGGSWGITDLAQAVIQKASDRQREELVASQLESKRLRQLCETLSNILQDHTVAMQSAIIEWKHGKGAKAGLQWIVNTLIAPGNLPDFDAEYGKNAQFWFDTHQSDPSPKCFCGNPSHIVWMGQGFCCDEHYREVKAKQAAIGASSNSALGEGTDRG